MKVVIKTKDRVQLFYKKTYSKILLKYNFNLNDVYLFVSTEKDLDEYSDAYPKCHIILGPEGISAIDNYIVDFFPEGEVYLYMNDDVSGVYRVENEKEMSPVKDLKGLMSKLANEMKELGYSYGGLYPVCNPYYMYNQKYSRRDLCLIMDPVSICINNKDVKLTEIMVPLEDGTTFKGECSDAEKCILHFKSKGGTLRYNRFAAKVQYYGKVGGYQGRTAFTEKYTAEYMMNKYSDYVGGINFKKDGHTSLRFKKKYPLRKFVISMEDSIGFLRRKFIKYKYEHFRGIKGPNAPMWMIDKFKHRSGIGVKKKWGKIGNFASYYYLLHKIVNEKINNVIILEDDCHLNHEFTIEDLGDEPLMLNGVVHHPKNWAKRNRLWVQEMLEYWKGPEGPKCGVNTIDYEKYRMTGTIGMFLPKWQDARRMIEYLKKSKVYTSIDIMLVKKKFFKKFYYPNLFYHDDRKVSNIEAKGYGRIDYFFERELKY